MRIKPKKSLGQNFLIDKNIQRKIIDSCGFTHSDIVLEIGSGRGDLTEQIIPRVKKLYALEIDANLCSLLEEKFSEFKNIEIIKEDILKFDFKKHFSSKVKVIGNIPYYISSPIIERLVDYREIIKAIFLTVQKEFACRMRALPGSKDYGSFSCFVQFYLEPEILFDIKKGSFLPQPKVDSSFLRLEVREKRILYGKNEELLFRITRAAFNKRRKTLRNSLEGLISEQQLREFFTKFHIDPNTRPERLSLQDFANLALIKNN